MKILLIPFCYEKSSSLIMCSPIIISPSQMSNNVYSRGFSYLLYILFYLLNIFKLYLEALSEPSGNGQHVCIF